MSTYRLLTHHIGNTQEPEKQPDYEAQTKNELEKVQQKAILLNDMLNNVDQSERIGIEGDAYDVSLTVRCDT